MKVLTIREPWATLIKDNIKKIETRSWKTLYRGELYIHAGMLNSNKKIESKELLELIKDIHLNYGYIICKCNLVDCIYMDEEFVNKIKEDKIEFTCGNYEIGRYAWILDNIEVLEMPIKTKGRLSIWNYEGEEYGK